MFLWDCKCKLTPSVACRYYKRTVFTVACILAKQLSHILVMHPKISLFCFICSLQLCMLPFCSMPLNLFFLFFCFYTLLFLVYFVYINPSKLREGPSKIVCLVKNHFCAGLCKSVTGHQVWLRECWIWVHEVEVGAQRCPPVGDIACLELHEVKLPPGWSFALARRSECQPSVMGW